MTDSIDAFYWIHSDWAYFGGPRLKAMGERHGLKVNHRPVDLATVYARTGGIKLPYRSAERKNYRLLEMKRFREILGMPINLEPKYFCVTGHLPSWFVIAAQELGHDVADLSQAIMRAIWVEDRDAEDPATLVSIGEEMGLEGTKILKAAQDPRTELTYMKYTNEAIERGVFGAPFYFFRGEAFWGQDRLDMLDKTISRALGS
ncbi:2-hydroxychromene-2-carboxylate isomerase [Variovorax paradoxus]|uniref:2-hydroxychromene-2-carboxylate isomerase n=1 Tax=Variovorax paradoxus TaxID=34073 RepID=UPI00278059F6|nr:2-hydroxychromene-2-carboxylate isomerase [Variovorax paradoxus]MDQ0589971.1 2-hydroxychromene-2-carboxylate isomerase [Variovorax paradoxus]